MDFNFTDQDKGAKHKKQEEIGKIMLSNSFLRTRILDFRFTEI